MHRFKLRYVLTMGVLITLPIYQATAASPAKQLEEKVDALRDIVCVQAVVFNDKNGRLGVTTPKACREAAHIVFVSSQAFNGNLGTLTDADPICNLLAANAGLPGIYKTWVTGETNPDTRPPAFRFSRSFGPYVLVDGTIVANDWDDLTDGSLAAPINLNEKGEITSVEVWTGVAVDGTRLNSTREDTCNNLRSSSASYRGTFGLSTETGSAWSNANFDSCDQEKALYCFGQ